MAGEIVELYTDGDMAALRRRIKRWTAVMAGVGLAGLGTCIALAALTTTANALRMEMWSYLVSTLSGWVAIYIGIFVVTAGTRELRHAQMLREEERQREAGTVTVTEERFRIRKSVPVRRVLLRREDGEKRLLVTGYKAEKLAGARPAAVYTVHGYVAAWEEEP